MEEDDLDSGGDASRLKGDARRRDGLPLSPDLVEDLFKRVSDLDLFPVVEETFSFPLDAAGNSSKMITLGSDLSSSLQSFSVIASTSASFNFEESPSTMIFGMPNSSTRPGNGFPHASAMCVKNKLTILLSAVLSQ